MHISKLELINFRNYKYLETELTKDVNLFYGENSSGKTNIIESIFYIAVGKSFRCSDDEYLVNNDSKFFKIEIEQINENDISIKYSVEFNKDINKKIIKENEKNIKKISYLIGKIPIVLFSPENIYMVKGEPILRRKYIDNMLSNTDNEYYLIINKYNKILGQRNKVLKLIKENKADKKEIITWNIQLKEYSYKIIDYRIKTINKINEIIYKNFLKKDMTLFLKYKIRGFDENNYKNLNEYFECFFERNLNEEIIRTMTLIGPHRDDIEINLNERSLKYFGSEGQQRLSCIILKLAEGLYIKEKNNVYPIVLLDDFTSELDETNKSFIAEIFNIFKQIIITTTSKDNVKNIKIDRCFFVENGQIKKVE